MNIKPFAKNERKLETLIQTIRIYSQDILREFGMEKSHANYRKRKKTIDRRNKSTKSRKNQNGPRKVNLEVFCNIGSRHHQTSGDKRKN